MRGDSLVSRVSRATVLASLVTAVALAAASATISFWLWRAREQRALQETVAALAAAVERESVDEKSSLEAASAEAIRESGVTNFRIEAWQGDRLLATNLPGVAVGIPRPGNPPSGWLVSERSLAGGLRVLAAGHTRGLEALRVFGWSLLAAIPLCVSVALIIGDFVGRRATRPLVAFKGRIVGAQPFEPLREGGIPGAPDEVRELDDAFHGLWRRLQEALAREVEFAANASHELRTPLTRIRLRAERAKADAGPQAREELEAQVAEVDQMVRLVESLLVLARDVKAGIPRAETVNLADTLRTVGARVLEAFPPAGAELPDEALVRGDEDLLSIAVLNLLDNAAKFKAPARSVVLRLGETSGRVRLAVESPGARIPEGEQERLFERFYRGPEARTSPRGHGLGLPLARHIARLHGGDVRCVSGRGEDACFELDLPSWTARSE